MSTRRAIQFGVRGTEAATVDFPALMARLRRLRAQISENDSVARFQKLGVDVFLGQARFTGADAVEVDGQRLRFRRAIIATGACAARPEIPGLADVGYFTNETIFGLTELPARLGVIGAGPAGCELAQAFAWLGSAVTLIGADDQVLPRDDPDASALLAKALQEEGVQLRLGRKVKLAESFPSARTLVLDTLERVEVDAILVTAGRTPNVDGLDLDRAGVQFGPDGVQVNDRLQTTNQRIFAAGDVCSSSSLLMQPMRWPASRLATPCSTSAGRASTLTIPWATYTDPEVAHIGLTERDAARQRLAIDTYTQPMSHVDRAVLDGETTGFVKIHVRKGTDRIVGATIIARHAGEMISEIALLMTNQLGLKSLARTIHPYPTQAEALRKVADAYQRSRLSSTVAPLMRRWFRWGQ